jgi:signal transduction histidine kinase/CheY-like chemotaxis protein
MVYREFDPAREPPLYQVDWAGELQHLRMTTMDTVALALAAAGYVWVVLQWFLVHPRFSWAAISLPLAVGSLGLLSLLLRPWPLPRTVAFVGGSVAIGATALLFQRSPYAPFISVAAIGAASLVSSSTAAFVAAALATGILAGAVRVLPGLWPAGFVSAAAALYWAMAAIAWLTSRDLYTVLTWALHGYETSLRTMRQVQAQTGKLNRTMRALAVANALLKRTTYDLAEARDEAEQARALKAQFAANISHELRTPLHIIVGFSQMMCTSPDSYHNVTWTPELRGDIQEVYENASHLLRLIDDVLDLSRMESVRLPVTKERVSLADLVNDAVDTASALLRGRSLALRVDIPGDLPPLFVDPTRIRQVLINLLANAARFTDSGSITVRALLHENEAEVVVADTGVGIPAEQLPHVFSEFYQVDSSLRRRHGGTGLGLAICKHFVSLHGGRIWVDSEVGHGSAFHFTLPLPGKRVVAAQVTSLPGDWHYPASKPEGVRRVVTLATPAPFAHMLERYLQRTQVLAAAGPAEAAAAARESQADAIVLAGSQREEALADELAAATADLAMPVITCALPQEQDLAEAQGFSYTLAKPFTSQQLAGTVAEAAPKAQKVLVVDDDAGVVRLAERTLKMLLPGVTVLKAYDGDRAMTLLSHKPDLVLLDLILPGTDGLGVLGHLRENPETATLPVVAITAHDFGSRAAPTGGGCIAIRRGRQFAAGEVTRWVESALLSFPARHLAPGGQETAPAPVGPG